MGDIHSLWPWRNTWEQQVSLMEFVPAPLIFLKIAFFPHMWIIVCNKYAVHVCNSRFQKQNKTKLLRRVRERKRTQYTRGERIRGREGGQDKGEDWGHEGRSKLIIVYFAGNAVMIPLLWMLVFFLDVLFCFPTMVYLYLWSLSWN